LPSYPHHLRRIRFKDPETGKTLIFLTSLLGASPTTDHLRTLQSQVASRVVFRMDQATSPYQEILRHVKECRQAANLDRRVGVRAGSHHQEAPQPGCLALHFVTGLFSHPFRENSSQKGLIQYQAYPEG
jgi:hypothetical protein